MKVFIYVNKEKDINGINSSELKSLLTQYNIEYLQLTDEDLKCDLSADAIFTLGGDGTILWVVEFANRNSIPIIGINIGKVGFLTEFDKNDMENAVKLLKTNQLKKDSRLTLEVSVNNIKTIALNDAFVQRIYSEDIGCMTTDIAVSIDNKQVEEFKGDGIVVSSPTGSTAYSLSVGGSILSPDVNALLVTPIAPHTLGIRSIVFSSESVCQFELTGKASGGLFVDGRSVCTLNKGDKVFVKKADYQTTFLRKYDFDFYKRFSLKLKDRVKG